MITTAPSKSREEYRERVADQLNALNLDADRHNLFHRLVGLSRDTLEHYHGDLHHHDRLQIALMDDGQRFLWGVRSKGTAIVLLPLDNDGAAKLDAHLNQWADYDWYECEIGEWDPTPVDDPRKYL